MLIRNEEELAGIKAISHVAAVTLKEMREYARPGMSTGELDEYGGKLLAKMGARSAPMLAYKFPGFACICVNNEVAHGIPSKEKILQEGDLVNIDVSAELKGFWADNGSSFVLGEDIKGHQKLVDASRSILRNAIAQIKGGARIAATGKLIETQAKAQGFRVIKNLAGHGVGRSLHEPPEYILNCNDVFNRERFTKNSVIAVETFISTHSTKAIENGDGWTLVGNRGGFVAQHEHTLMVTEGEPIIFTFENGN